MAQAPRLTNRRNGKRTAVSWAVRSIFPGIFAEAEGDPLGQGRRQEQARERDEAGHDEEDVEDVRGQPVLGVLPLGLLPRQDRDERGREGGLGEEVAEKIGDAEGDVEGIRGGADPEEMGEDGLPHEAHDPAHGRADGEGPDPSGDIFHGSLDYIKSGPARLTPFSAL